MEACIWQTALCCNQISYHGKGAIEEIANEAKARRLTKAFVCTDPDLVKFGVTQKVLTVLDKNGLAYELYSNVKPNPTIENVQHRREGVPGLRRGLHRFRRRRLGHGHGQRPSASS